MQSKPLKRRKLDRAFWRLVSRRVVPSREGAPGVLWLQAVSVGEVEVAVTFAREVRILRPALPILSLNSGDPSSLHIASASSFTAIGFTRNPVSPSITTSRAPSTS